MIKLGSIDVCHERRRTMAKFVINKVATGYTFHLVAKEMLFHLSEIPIITVDTFWMMCSMDLAQQIQPEVQHIS